MKKLRKSWWLILFFISIFLLMGFAPEPGVGTEKTSFSLVKSLFLPVKPDTTSTDSVATHVPLPPGGKTK